MSQLQCVPYLHVYMWSANIITCCTEWIINSYPGRSYAPAPVYVHAYGSVAKMGFEIKDAHKWMDPTAILQSFVV